MKQIQVWLAKKTVNPFSLKMIILINLQELGFSVVKEISEEEKNSKEEQIRAIARERKELEKKRLARIEEMEMKELLEKEVAIEIKKEEKMRKEFERSLELRRKLEE